MGSAQPVVQRSPFLSSEERHAERELKRDAVLLAAVRMFNAQGYHQATLDDIAASLGISKPTVYQYLGNKEQVLFACLERGLEQMLQAAANASESSGSGLDKLRAFMFEYVEVILGDFGQCVVRTPGELLSAENAARFRERGMEVHHAVRRLIIAGVKDGSIMPSDANILAYTLVGALRWPAHCDQIVRNNLNKRIASQMVEMLTFGLAARSAAALEGD